MKSKFSIPLFVIMLTCLLYECKRNSTSSKTNDPSNDSIIKLKYPVTIDIGSKMHEFSENNISDLIEDIEYVPLEFTKDCPLGNFFLPIVTNKYIFAFTDKIYVFSRSGKFIRTIGRAGKGPEEYGIYLMSCNVDIINELIYVKRYGGSGVIIYDFEGNFIKNIRVALPDASEIGEISLIEANVLFLQYGVMFPYYKDYKLGWCISQSGDVLYTRKSFVTQNLEKLSLRESARRPLPFTNKHIWYQYENKTMFYEFLNDTIFTITKQGFVPRYIFDYGKYKCPVENMTSYKDRFNKNYILPESIVETERFLFFHFLFDERACTGIFDKSRNVFEIRASNRVVDLTFQKKYDYLINDFDGGVSDAIPLTGARAIPMERIQEQLTSEHFAKMKNKVKHPEKMEKLKKLINNMDENDNPIVAIYYFKK